MKTKKEIEFEFLNNIRLFTLHPENSKKTIIQIIDEYNLEFAINEIPDERNFNAIIFAHLFTKIRTIGFSVQAISNSDFIVIRKYLIQELNRKNLQIAIDFGFVLSDSNIKKLNKEIYKLLYIAFSHYVEIFNNLHQYKVNIIAMKIKIAETYINDVMKKNIDHKFITSLQNINSFLFNLINEEKSYLTIAST